MLRTLAQISLIACLAFAVFACDDGADQGSATRASTPPAEFGELPPDVAACGVEPTGATLTRGWALPPASEHAAARDSIIGAFDLAVGTDGSLYAIDREIARATVIRESALVHFGGRGSGPGEFMNPTAITQRGNTVYVAEAGRVHVFSTAGEFKKSWPSSMRAIGEIAVLGNDDVVLTRNVTTGTGPGNSTGFTYVALADSNGAIKTPILKTDSGSKRQRPLIAPSMNPVAVTAGRRGFAVWYPFDNYVQVFDAAGIAQYSYIGCLPGELESYYRRIPEGSRYQNARALTLGVWLNDDNSLLIASSDRNGDQRAIRIRRVDHTGQETSSVKAVIQGDELFNHVVFADPQTMIAHTLVPGMGIRRWSLAN